VCKVSLRTPRLYRFQLCLHGGVTCISKTKYMRFRVRVYGVPILGPLQALDH
jgi:hypothetical protein